jgi:hypothetical protein
MMLLIATAVVTAVSMKNENIYTTVNENIVWDNGMNYDLLGVSVIDPTVEYDWIGADDFMFEEDTKVIAIKTIAGYSGTDYQNANFDIVWQFYQDQGDGNAPGENYTDPFLFTPDMIDIELINDTGNEIYYLYYAEFPYTLEFSGGQKYWTSGWGIGELPVKSGSGIHYDPIKLHQCVGKSEYEGYPDWMNVEDITYLEDPVDACFQLLTSFAPTIPDISGPPSGKTGEQQDYTFSSSDPEGDDITYCIDWGDGTDEISIGPFPSGDEIKQSHTWDEDGTYTIKVKAQDKFGMESEWGELDVSMPKTKTYNLRILLQQFLEKHSYLFSLLEQLLDV